MTVKVNEVGTEPWIANPSGVKVSETGTEPWIANPAYTRVVQVGLEVWATVSPRGAVYVWIED